MKKFTAILLLASASAFGQPSNLNAVVRECEVQMALGICTAENDGRAYPPDATVIIGRTRVPRSSYDLLRQSGKDMCKVVRAAGLADAAGPVWKAAEALYVR